MTMDPKPTATRRQFIATTTAAAAAFTIVPRHVLGGQRFVAPSDKVNVAIIGAGGQGRTNARALFQEDDCQVIALADPAEEWDLSQWYYGGKAGRGPVKAEVEKHYSAKTPNHKCAVTKTSGSCSRRRRPSTPSSSPRPTTCTPTSRFSR